MKSTGSFAVKLAGTTGLAILLTTSAFADYRHQDQTYRRDTSNRAGNRDSNYNRARNSNRGGNYSRDGNTNGRTNNDWSENDRVSLQGKVTSISREHNGHRVKHSSG